MKIHTLFVEPANYTQDLIANVHHKMGISYSFLYSSSAAASGQTSGAVSRFFDQYSQLSNIAYLWKCSRQYNLIIVNGYNHLSFILLWIFGFFNSCFVGIESDTPYHERKGLKELLKSIWLKLVFSCPHVLGFPGGHGKHYDLFINYGMCETRIFTLPMMVDNAKYYKPLSNDTSDNEGVIKFLCVARLAPEKNIPLLVAAFKTLLVSYKNIQLDLVGDGPQRAEIEVLVKDIPEISLHGKKFGAALLQFYKNNHVLILPSIFEPWGLVVNEAMAAGMAVVCSDEVGASHDLLSNTDSGWIFENNNQQDLTESLADIIEHPHQIYSNGKNAQDFMMNHWNYHTYIESLNKILSYVKSH